MLLLNPIFSNLSFLFLSMKSSSFFSFRCYLMSSLTSCISLALYLSSLILPKSGLTSWRYFSLCWTMLARPDLAGDLGVVGIASFLVLWKWNPPNWEEPNVVFTLLVVLPKLLRLCLRFSKSTFLCFWAGDSGGPGLLSVTAKIFWCEIYFFLLMGFARSWLAAFSSNYLTLSTVSNRPYEFVSFYPIIELPSSISSVPIASRTWWSLNFWVL